MRRTRLHDGVYIQRIPPILEPVVEAKPEPVVEPEKPPASNPDVVPESLKRFVLSDENVDEFRKRLWLMVQRFGVEEGEHGYDYPPLTADERKEFLPMLVANFEAGNWLQLSSELKPT